MVAEFLREPDLDVRVLAERVSRRLTRNEQSRLRHWDNAREAPGAIQIEGGW